MSHLLSDCGSPEKLGYNLGTPTALTYGGTVSVTSCATGYNGTVTITEINCQDTGLWSDPEGCTIIGKFYISNMKNLFNSVFLNLSYDVASGS